MFVSPSSIVQFHNWQYQIALEFNTTTFIIYYTYIEDYVSTNLVPYNLSSVPPSTTYPPIINPILTERVLLECNTQFLIN